MTGILQPLDSKFAIVDRNGNPTDYFIRWAQQKQIDIGSSITLTDLANYLAAHKLASGQGIALTPDGNLADSPSVSILNGTGLDFDVMHNLKLADTAVAPGTYGDATHVPAIVVDQQGRITGVTLVAISGGGGGGALSLVSHTAFATISSAAPVIITGLDTLNYDYKLSIRLNRPLSGAAATDFVTLQLGDTAVTPVWSTTTVFMTASGAVSTSLTSTAGISRIAQVQNNTTLYMGTEFPLMFTDDGKCMSALAHSFFWENIVQMDTGPLSSVIGALKLGTVNQAWSGSYSLYKLAR